MRDPELVADCVRAMQDAVSIPVTVKHRLGIDSIEDYDFARRFVRALASAGCRRFVVHARNAMLKGLSPRDNREVPPLRYAEVYRLKREFPELAIVINGGIASCAQVEQHLVHVDGVMLGRAAYHDPYLLAQANHRLFDSEAPPPTRQQLVHIMYGYAREEITAGTPLRSILRHMLGLYHGQPSARLWRRKLSDSVGLALNEPRLLLDALEAVSAHRFAAA
jgi:tRNA-dihydrouridine synthase A